MRCDSDRFKFDDGGVYEGEYEAGKSHGFGVYSNTGPGRTETYAGSWKFGYEISGVYTWNNGRNHYAGQWWEGKRHGSAVEKRDGWIYRGEYSNGYKGRYGVRESCMNSTKYEGTWTSGLQDGYGVETYSDGGVYQGQWLRGLRHGYGTRISAMYTKASAKHKSNYTKAGITTNPSKLSANPFLRLKPTTATHDLDTVLRERSHRIQFLAGGFVLVPDLCPEESRRGFHRMRLSLRETLSNVRKTKTGSTTDVTCIANQTTQNARTPPTLPKTTLGRHRSSLSAIDDKHASAISVFQSACNLSSFVDLTGTGVEICDGSVVEKYQGEWKQDKRTGYGVCQRSDGLKYEGEWVNDRKHGYGITTLPNGKQLIGKYKNNVLASSAGDLSGARKRFDFLSLRSNTLRERAESAVQMAQTAANNAMQKAEISLVRMSTAKTKAVEADSKASEAEKNEQRAQFRIGEIVSNDLKPGANIQINKQLLERSLIDYELGFPGSQVQRQPTYVAPSRFSLFKTKKQKQLELEAAQKEQEKRDLEAENVILQTVEAFQNDPNQSLTAGQQTSISNQYSANRAIGDVIVDAKHISQSYAERKNPSKRMMNRQSSASYTHDAMNLVQLYDRRNSLPSIYKQQSVDPNSESDTQTPSAPSPGTPPSAKIKIKTETFVVVKGVRKRVQSLFEDPAAEAKKLEMARRRPGGDSALTSLMRKTVQASFAIASSSSRAWSRSDPDETLEKLYKIESPKMKRKGSTPDVSLIHSSEVMPREEVYAMSQRKREENIKERAETDERRKNNEIVISFSSAKDWVTLLVVIVNAGLAAVFYNLLSQP